MNLTDHAEDLAKELQGNWQRFPSFAWRDRHDVNAPETWAIVYTHNRDSDVLERCNAKVIERELEKAEYEGDVRGEHHGHWACGWIDGYAIRVRNAAGDLTPAFLAYAKLHVAKENYPILDEHLLSEMEQEEANEIWSSCYNDRQRLEYIRDRWSEFEHCHAEYYPDTWWRTLLENVRGRYFGGCASELLA